jgi:dTDP-4-amino-4,6-dideoxygalactose transaminase
VQDEWAKKVKAVARRPPPRTTHFVLEQEEENIYAEMITLPLFPKMTKRDVEDVIEAVLKVHEYYQVIS